MNFDHNNANISAFTKWCERGIVLILLSMVIACGGGGGGSTLTAAEIEAKFKFENTTTNPGPYYPNDQLVFKATYPVGEAQIIVRDKNNANNIVETYALDQYSDKQYVAIAPKAGAYSYFLKVSYQDPSMSRPSMKEWTTQVGIDIVISPLPVAPQYFSSVSWNTNRADHAAAKLRNGDVLISGGTDGTNVLKSAMIFDAVNAKWTAIPDMKFARRGHTMTLLHSGKVLVTGGFDGKTSLATAEVYDPGQNAWLPTTEPMKLSRRFHTATRLPDETVLIVGGIVGLLPTDDPKKVEIYDEATGKFSYGTSISEARTKHTATLIATDVNNPVYKVLLTGNSDNSAIAWAYNYSLKTWTPAGASTYTLDRYSHSAEAMNSTQTMVMISGGYIKSKDGKKAISNAVEIYDATEDKWKVKASMNTPRALHTSTRLTNGSILVVGGHDGKNVLTSAEIYDPKADSWRDLKLLLNTPRALHSAIKLDNDDVLISGTYFQTSGLIVSTTEVIKEADTNK
jgi:N-acetylneuraminic acid mutarotase